MRLDKFAIGILVFSAIVISGAFVWSGVISEYDINTTNTSVGANFSAVYNLINDTFNLSQEAKADTLYSDIEGADESWNSMLKGAYKAVKFVAVDAPPLLYAIIFHIFVALHLPPFLAHILVIGFWISILFGIIYLFFRFKG